MNSPPCPLLHLHPLAWECRDRITPAPRTGPDRPGNTNGHPVRATPVPAPDRPGADRADDGPRTVPDDLPSLHAEVYRLVDPVVTAVRTRHGRPLPRVTALSRRAQRRRDARMAPGPAPKRDECCRTARLTHGHRDPARGGAEGRREFSLPPLRRCLPGLSCPDTKSGTHIRDDRRPVSPRPTGRDTPNTGSLPPCASTDDTTLCGRTEA